jgi:hypothetical protein
MNILRACADWRVIAVLVAVGIGVAVFAPNLMAAAVPLLLVATCPLSMLVMMRTMAGHPANPSPEPVLGSDDRPSQLREQLASTRREQGRLERELALAEATDRIATADTHGITPAADAGARPS